jgi:ribosomal protein S21
MVASIPAAVDLQRHRLVVDGVNGWCADAMTSETETLTLIKEKDYWSRPSTGRTKEDREAAARKAAETRKEHERQYRHK